MEFDFKILIGVGLAVIGSWIFFYGFNRMHRWRMIKDIPRSKIRSVAIGICEIHGSVKPLQIIKTPFSNSDSVYYRYEIKEYKRHRSTDSKGKTRTRYSWDTIALGDKRIPFLGLDETGEIHIDPSQAEFNVDNKKAFYQKRGIFGGISSLISSLKMLTEGREASLDVSELSLEPINPSDSSFSFGFGNNVGDRKYYEAYLEPEENLFLIGTAANSRETPNNIFITKGEEQTTYIISNKSEGEVLKSLRNKMIVSFIFGGLLFGGGIILSLHLAKII